MFQNPRVLVLGVPTGREEPQHNCGEVSEREDDQMKRLATEIPRSLHVVIYPSYHPSWRSLPDRFHAYATKPVAQNA